MICYKVKLMIKTSSLKITFLGTGTSHGIPVLACSCNVCKSNQKKNIRFRSSVLLSWDNKNILIDTPPELRLQLLRENILSVDSIFITHCHADHVYGLDDVRVFSKKNKIPVFAEKSSIKELESIFPYVFKKTQKGGGKPKLKLNIVDSTFNIFGKSVIPLKLFHGNKIVYGYRIDNFAYLTDCNKIPITTMKLLKDLDVLVLDATRKEKHPTHFSLEEALLVAKEINATQTYFTHISHSINHFSDRKNLLKKTNFAFDGLKLNMDTF